MKTLIGFGLFICFIVLLLAGCVTASGESFQAALDQAVEENSFTVIHQLGDMETCMFTLWAITKPDDRPTPERALEWCRTVTINMGEEQYQEVMEFIEELVAGMTKIDCSGGQCL
jgi:hypothetical protein